VKVADFISSKVNALTTGTFGASILVSGSLNLGMQYLWSYLNTIQILSVLPLFRLKMPAFLVVFCSNINKFNLLIFDLGDTINENLGLKDISTSCRD
jgi:hypothetical protein